MNLSTESTCKCLKDRYDRAMAESIHVVDIDPGKICILGETGNVYYVEICQRPRCTCADSTGNYVLRGVCKHIVYVYCILGKAKLKEITKGYVVPQILQEIKTSLDVIKVNAPSRVRYVYEKIKRSFCDICETEHKYSGDKWKQSTYHENCMAVTTKVCLEGWRRESNSSVCPVCGDEWNIESMEKEVCGYLNLKSLIVNENKDETNDENEIMGDAEEIQRKNVREDMVATKSTNNFNLTEVEAQVNSNWSALLSKYQKEEK